MSAHGPLKTSWPLKIKEIIFHRPAARNLCIPHPLPGIERVKQATLLGVDVTDTLSTAAMYYVDDRLYLCKLIRVCISYPFFNLPVYTLQRSSLHLLFNALVINKLTYALPAYAGQLTADDKNPDKC